MGRFTSESLSRTPPSLVEDSALDAISEGAGPLEEWLSNFTSELRETAKSPSTHWPSFFLQILFHHELHWQALLDTKQWNVFWYRVHGF